MNYIKTEKMIEEQTVPAQAEQQAPQMSEAEQNTLAALTGINDNPSPALAALGENLAQQQAAPIVEAQPNVVEPSLLNSDLNPNNVPAAEKPVEQVLAEQPDAAPAVEVPAVSEAPTEENVIDSPLFKAPAAPTQESQALAQIDGIEGVNTFISEKHPEIKDLNSLMTSYESMTTENASLLEMKAQNESLINGLSSLDPDLVEAIRLYESGEDYRAYLNTQPNVSYDSKVEDIDKQTLINAYFPGKISEADFEASVKDSEDYDPNVARLIDTVHESAVTKFNTDKAGKVGRADSYLAAKENKQALIKESIGKSLGSVQEFFPDATPTYIKSVEERLLNDGIKNMFYDENGQFKPDAAARFVRASDDGANLVSQLQKIAYNKAKTDANLDTLTRGQRTAPESSGREMRQDGSKEEVDAFMADVVGNVTEQSYY